MVEITDQLNKWTTNFGKEYSDRNAISFNELEELYKKNYGITRTEVNKLFLNEMDRSIRILEIGCNIGNQLLGLQKMGFNNLYGIEPQNYAVELSKKRIKNVDIIKGNIFDIPFKDKYFDLVFTSAILIHISPEDIAKAMRETYRCSRKYIWGFEYYAEKYEEVVYRGQKNLLWKTDFLKLYLDLFPDLEVVKEKKLNYLNNDNVDIVFLLKKKTE